MLPSSIGLDEVIAAVQVAVVLERELQAARLGVDAHPGRLADPVGQRGVERLHEHAADVAPHPLLEHVDHEPPILLRPIER